MSAREEIGRRIAIARCALGLSQQRIADAIGIQRTALSDIEVGRRNVTATELVALASELGRTVGWIVSEEPGPQPAPPVGDVLRQTLRAFGLTQASLARRTGLSTKHINQVMQGYAPVSPTVAVAIGNATGIPAEVWIVLDAVHQVQRIAAAPHDPARTEAARTDQDEQETT